MTEELNKILTERKSIQERVNLAYSEYSRKHKKKSIKKTLINTANFFYKPVKYAAEQINQEFWEIDWESVIKIGMITTTGLVGIIVGGMILGRAVVSCARNEASNTSNASNYSYEQNQANEQNYYYEPTFKQNNKSINSRENNSFTKPVTEVQDGVTYIINSIKDKEVFDKYIRRQKTPESNFEHNYSSVKNLSKLNQNNKSTNRTLKHNPLPPDGHKDLGNSLDCYLMDVEKKNFPNSTTHHGNFITVKNHTKNSTIYPYFYNQMKNGEKTYMRGPITHGNSEMYSIGGGVGIMICVEIKKNNKIEEKCKEFMFDENGTRFTWKIYDKYK